MLRKKTMGDPILAKRRCLEAQHFIYTPLFRKHFDDKRLRRRLWILRVCRQMPHKASDLERSP
jgi:hypothetical protein